MFNFNNTLKRVRLYTLVLSTLFIVSCGGGGGGTPPAGSTGTPQTLNVTVSWTANNEAKVNTTGGGYTVYYSQSSGFNIGDAGVTPITVPYAAGATSPTSTVIPLSSGTYYVRVAAFGLTLGTNHPSLASPQTVVTVPFVTP